MKFSKAPFGLTILMLFSGFFSAASSHADDFNEPSRDLIHSRSYVGGFLSYMGIDNDKDFDGNGAAFSLSPFEFDLIPGINAGVGFGALLGHREGDVALEVSYWRSEHTSYWAPGTSFTIWDVATYQSVEVNFKRYLFTEQALQPFLQVGLSNPWVTYPSSSTDGLGTVSAFTISGLGIDAGGGVEFYIDDVFSIFGGLLKSWTRFDHAYGARKIEWTTLFRLEGDGLDFYAGGTMKLW